MSKRLSKDQQMYVAVLDKTAKSLGLEVGTYRAGGKKHDSYTVTLPNGAPVKVAVYCTPANAQGYAPMLQANLRSAILRNLERGGNT